MFEWRIMFSTLLTLTILFYIVSFTQFGTWLYGKIGLGSIQAAVVANPPIILLGLLLIYIIFDRSMLNGLIIFATLLTITIIQFPVMTPNIKPEIGQTFDVRIATVNMLFSNKSVDADLLTILSHDADIVMLQEFNVRNASQETLKIVKQKYPYSSFSVGAPETSEGEKSTYEYSDKEHRLGLAVFSKTPLKEEKANGRLYQIVHTKVNGKNVNIVNIHTVSPVTLLRHKAWVDSFKQINTVVEETITNNTSSVTVLGGDFNANHNHSPFRNLIITNNLYQNRNQTPTWGVKTGGVKLFKLDHILTTSNAHPTVVKKIYTQGSDHDGILAKISWLK
jgi:endonuclease/exonuclease/phosphatase (EEP) superfamily protein YafD